MVNDLRHMKGAPKFLLKFQKARVIEHWPKGESSLTWKDHVQEERKESKFPLRYWLGSMKHCRLGQGAPPH